MRIGNYKQLLAINHIDRMIKECPKEMLSNEDLSILVSKEIYNNVKRYLIDEKYKGFLIYTIDNVPKNKIYVSSSKYHN